MPRAHRHFLPGYAWHITHRCHKQEFLLKFARDRKYWIHWLYQATRRYGLSVLNYRVTSNHIHLLVVDTGNDVIPKSMQLIAGRVAQAYNQRKQRKGAYWEDRYHATAVETDEHLIRCLIYLDLNMVRAGVVNHPKEWIHSGYYEIHHPPQRKGIIDYQRLVEVCGLRDDASFQELHQHWVETQLSMGANDREPHWSDAAAVGNEDFIETIRNQLGYKAKGRRCHRQGQGYQLKEPRVEYALDFKPKKGD